MIGAYYILYHGLVELMKRLLTFVQKCFNCDNKLVNFTTRSPLGCSVFQCCSRYDFEYERFMSLSHQYIQGYCRSMVSPEDAGRVRMLLEMLFIRSGAFCLDNFTLSDVKVLINSLCIY